MAKGGIPKTAFRCHKGTIPVMIPFDLCKVPAVFQRITAHFLSRLIGVSVQVCLEDIIEYSRNANDHEYHLQCDLIISHNERVKPLTVYGRHRNGANRSAYCHKRSTESSIMTSEIQQIRARCELIALRHDPCRAMGSECHYAYWLTTMILIIFYVPN